MTARAHFRGCMAERRQHPRGSLDWEYLTRAARTYARIARRVPVNEWKD